MDSSSWAWMKTKLGEMGPGSAGVCWVTVFADLSFEDFEAEQINEIYFSRGRRYLYIPEDRMLLYMLSCYFPLIYDSKSSAPPGWESSRSARRSSFI
jgi:hypothetical protein